MKNALKNSIITALKKAVQVKKIDGVNAEIFIKKATIKEMFNIEQNQSGDKVAEKFIALILCDKNGELIFDFENEQDLQDISEFANLDFVNLVRDEFMKFNGIAQNSSNEKK